jgi:hypothetical protein
MDRRTFEALVEDLAALLAGVRAPDPGVAWRDQVAAAARDTRQLLVALSRCVAADGPAGLREAPPGVRATAAWLAVATLCDRWCLHVAAAVRGWSPPPGPVVVALAARLLTCRACLAATGLPSPSPVPDDRCDLCGARRRRFAPRTVECGLLLVHADFCLDCAAMLDRLSGFGAPGPNGGPSRGPNRAARRRHRRTGGGR